MFTREATKNIDRECYTKHTLAAYFEIFNKNLNTKIKINNHIEVSKTSGAGSKFCFDVTFIHSVLLFRSCCFFHSLQKKMVYLEISGDNRKQNA